MFGMAGPHTHTRVQVHMQTHKQKDDCMYYGGSGITLVPYLV